MNNNLQGFTIIEALIAIALFGIMTVLLFSTFFSSFNLTSKSQQQLTTTSQAQNIMETIRSAWSVSSDTGTSNYDYACVPSFTLPTGYTVQFWNLDARAQYVNSSNVVQATAPSASAVKFSSTSACSAAAGSTVTPSGGTAQSPTMRRVTVSTGTSSQDTTLTLDILDPQ